MNPTDRDEFKTVLGDLCAGFGVPLTKAREEGFWLGLKRMSLSQFRRCAEIALGEQGPADTSPTTAMMWRIYRGTAIDAPAPGAAALPADQDHLAYYANRLLWLHVSHRGGLGSVGKFVPAVGMVDCKASPELEKCLEFKRRLVWEFMGYIRERDEYATPAMFVRAWLAGMRRISPILPRTERDLDHLIGLPENDVPFPEFMARDIDVKYLREASTELA